MMFKKLTVNLKNSEDYGNNIQTDISTLNTAIIKTKTQISKIQNLIEEVTKMDQITSINIKRQLEELSSYDYKVQKVQIRLKEYTRKLELQQQTWMKKSAHKQILQKKIETLQTQISKVSQNNEQIIELKKPIEEADTKISRQGIQISNLFQQMIDKGKKLRSKEDQLQSKRKQNNKKRDGINHLDNLIKAQDHDKENKCDNICVNSEVKMQKLRLKKLQTQTKMKQKVISLLEMHDKFDQLSQFSNKIKNQVSRDRQIAQQLRSTRNTLVALKQSLTVPAK